MPNDSLNSRIFIRLGKINLLRYLVKFGFPGYGLWPR